MQNYKKALTWSFRNKTLILVSLMFLACCAPQKKFGANLANKKILPILER